MHHCSPAVLRLVPILVLVACGGHTRAAAGPAALMLPESTTVVDAGTGVPIPVSELLRRAAAADFVLLGEIHDNPVHHRVRGDLLRADPGPRPAVVFEQLAWSAGPIPPPAPGETEEAWLDANGFAREQWRWPLHQPVVDAALQRARSLWGSNLTREALRSVVREGVPAAPEALRGIAERVPLDSAARAAIDQELFESHCGKLPEQMMPGMRAAQEVRDAAMAEAMLAASGEGPVWLVAGDGHVRMDMGVPRLLRALAPAKRVLAVGFVERGTEEAVPGPAAAARYQVLVITPAAAREDPCAGL